MASFYVDSDWTGGAKGTPSKPFQSLTTAAWTRINTALASEDVIIYFAARKAASDLPSYYHAAGVDGVQIRISVMNRVVSDFRLTLNGDALYNTSLVTPAWTTNEGVNKCIVRDIFALANSHAKCSNWTVQGFNIVCNVSTKGVYLAGDNLVLENCDISHTEGVFSGPLVQVQPSADAAHEGSSAYVPACDNIVIRNNVIHDSYGELLYVGGGGQNPGTAGSGYPSHTNISILNNEFYHAGIFGAESDAIDIKGGITGLLVKGNDIHDCNTSTASPGRAIVTQGQPIPTLPDDPLQIYENNYIHDNSQQTEGIALSDTWGKPAGVIIRNNIISGISGDAVPRVGITVYSSQDEVLIDNNTIYGCVGLAIVTGSGSQVKLRNNFLFGNNGNVAQIDFSHGTIDPDYNAYSDTYGLGPTGANDVALTLAQCLAAVGDATENNFLPVAGSPLLGVAETQPGFSDDFLQNTRPEPWDIGAYERSPTGAVIIAGLPIP